MPHYYAIMQLCNLYLFDFFFFFQLLYHPNPVIKDFNDLYGMQLL